jgi:hypothetical protein
VPAVRRRHRALVARGDVKAHAGILESDDPATTRRKLAATVEPLFPSTAERAWIEGELARLVGAAEGEAAGERDESFAARRAFLEAVAAQRPLVLLIEDLQWAGTTLLEFVEYLAAWATAVPLVVLCTARPELYELHPAWSGGTRNATTISLSPLSNDDTARLIGALLERSVLAAETQQRLLERAGGNPLYAEQFVQMLRERPGDDVLVPETLQALIAARLDTLSPERKGLLQDAAVVGKVFWSGAVAAVGGLDERTVRDALHELVRSDLVRPSRQSSVEGQTELAFGHGLVRDVAYAQIPRAVRVRKHEAAAGWIEQVAGDRVADQAELLAHHYGEALAELRAAGDERGVGKALLLKSTHAWYTGDTRGASSVTRRSSSSRPRARTRAGACVHARGGPYVISGDPDGALEWAAKGMRLAEQLGSDRFAAHARQFGGMARCELGDFGGLEDMRESLQAALEGGWTRDTSTGFNNYGSWLWLTDGAAAALTVYREGIEFARRRGAEIPLVWSTAESTWALFDLGEWDELLAAVRLVEKNVAEQGAGKSLLIALTPKARVLFYRGEVGAAAEISADVLPRARAAGDPQLVVPALSLAMLVEPDPERIRAHGEELLRSDYILDPDAARACVRAGAVDLAERMAKLDERASPRTRHAAVAVRAMVDEAKGDQDAAARGYAEAARRWLDYPFVLGRGFALLGVTRTTGDASAGREAAAIFRSLGASTLENEAAA